MIDVELTGLDTLRARIGSLGSPKFRKRMLVGLGDEVVLQTKRRIGIEKTAPSGRAWKPWSTAYARTRGPEHSLLIDSGDMLRSIDHRIMSGIDAVVGTDVIYSRRQHDDRPFMGLSRENRADAESVGVGVIRQMLGGR